MRKLIGILGVAVIAATMFFSANNMTGSSSDASLAGIIAVSAANAESNGRSTECYSQSKSTCYDQTTGAEKKGCSGGQGSC